MNIQNKKIYVFAVIMASLMLNILTLSRAAGNYVLSLDGDEDYMEIVDSESLNNLDTQITVEFLIHPTQFTDEWMPIIYKGDEGEDDGRNRSFTFWLNHNGYIHFASAPSGEGQRTLDSPSYIMPGNWYHIAGVIDAPNHRMQLFVNGREVESRDDYHSDNIYASSLPLSIGWTHEEGWGYGSFAGFIDEVRIWDIARTPEEIQDTMNNPIPGNSEGLIAYWNFDEDKPVDSSDNGNDGILIGDAKLEQMEAGVSKPGSISGTVTVGMTGAPIPDMGVMIFVFDSNHQIFHTETDKQGQYKAEDLMPGKYRVSVDTYNIGLISEVYDDKSWIEWAEADPVEVGDGQDVTDVDFALERGGAISGMVVDAHAGFGVQDIEVRARDLQSGRYLGWSWTEWDGSYTIKGLPSSSYIVYADPSDESKLMGRYYQNTVSELEATSVIVTAPETISNINFELQPSYRIHEWLILAPIPDGKANIALNTDFLADIGGEARIAPSEGDTVEIRILANSATESDTVEPEESQTYSWKIHELSKWDGNNLNEVFGHHENVTAYLAIYFKAESAQRAEFFVGSDDTIAVWLNGGLVWYNPAHRGAYPDQDHFTAPVYEGWNLLVMKVSSTDGGWGAFARIANVYIPETAFTKPEGYEFQPEIPSDIIIPAIKGTVTDASGNPIPQAVIHIYDAQKQDELTLREAFPDGTYQILLTEGTYKLFVEAPDFIGIFYPSALNIENAASVILESDSIVTIDFQLIPEQDIITEWLVLGPFRGTGYDNIQEVMDTDFLSDVGGEGLFSPSEGDTVEYKGLALTWERQTLPTNSDNLGELFNRFLDWNERNGVVYLALYAKFDQTQEVDLWLGSNDAITLWLNGERVWENHVCRYNNKDEDRIRVAVREGWNLLFLKVANICGGEWGTFVRFPATAIVETAFEDMGVIRAAPWDANDDGQVNILDLVFLGRHFGEKPLTDPRADTNLDGKVDLLDLILVVQHFGEIISSVPAVPPQYISSNAIPIWLSYEQQTVNDLLFPAGLNPVENTQVIDVSIMTTPSTELYGFQFDIVFPSDVLEVVSVSEGDFVQNDVKNTYWHPPAIDNRAGYIQNIAAARVNTNTGIRTTNSLAVVTFRVKNPDQMFGERVQLENVKLVTTDGKLIPISLQKKSFALEGMIRPQVSALLQNYPNPFNPETWIPYKLANDASFVTITIYDAQGQPVRSMNLEQKPAGMYISKSRAVYWDGRNNIGERVGSGVYFYQLRAGEFRAVRKMVVMK